MRFMHPFAAHSASAAPEPPAEDAPGPAAPSQRPPPSYGAVGGAGRFSGYKRQGQPFTNSEGVLLVTLPLVVCAAIYILFANVYHHAWETICCAILALLIGDVIIGSQYGQSKYRIYLSGFILVGICSSAAVGLLSWQVAFSEYWLLEESNSYANVLPSESAAGFQDAGKIVFADGVRIDAERAVGYKDRSVYCVAPIVDEAHTGMVQFWAVGRNCCAARGAFWCGDSWSSKARAGVVVHDRKGQYWAAIRLAEAAMSLASAKDAILVDWVSDPELVELNLRRIGVSILLGALLVQLLLFCLGAGAVGAVRRGYSR